MLTLPKGFLMIFKHSPLRVKCPLNLSASYLQLWFKGLHSLFCILQPRSWDTSSKRQNISKHINIESKWFFVPRSTYQTSTLFFNKACLSVFECLCQTHGVKWLLSQHDLGLKSKFTQSTILEIKSYKIKLCSKFCSGAESTVSYLNSTGWVEY